MTGRSALLTLLLGLTAAIAPLAKAEPGDTAVLAARAEWHRALADADERALEAVLTDDFTVIESSGNRNDKTAVIERATKPPIAMTLVASRPVVRRSGAIATVTSAVVERRGSTRIDFEVTDVLVQSVGHWRVASSQWTRAADHLTEVQLTVAQLDSMAGRYRTPRGGILTVARHGQRLTITEPAGHGTEFIALSPTMISGPGGRVRWLFLTDPDGAIRHAVIANLTALTPLVRDTGP